MSEQTWWYLARSSGIIALVLLVLSVVWGVLLATRALRPYDRPAWLLDLHQWLGGVALVMTGLHLLGLYLDGYVEFGPAELFVPGASEYRPVAVAIGVLSLYALVAVQLTSFFRRHLSKRVWHGVHLLSYGLVWGSTVHAGMAGSDVTNRIYQGLAIGLTALTVAAVVLRLLIPRRLQAG